MQYEFHVQGMTCGHCERAVQQAVRAVDGQAEVQIDRAQNQVRVQSTAERAALVQAIQDEGYTVQA